MADDGQKVLLRSKEACVVLGVSPVTLDRLVRRGEIPVVRFDRIRRFRREALEEWAKRREETWTKRARKEGGR